MASSSQAAQSIMIRLAFIDAGTYCAKTKTGSVNGSIRFTPKASHGANKRLRISHDLLAPLKAAFPDVSFADLYRLASAVAIKRASGSDIPFRFGRMDASLLRRVLVKC